MPGLSCIYKDIALAEAGCEEQYAGYGSAVYYALPEDLKAAPTYDENSASFATSAFTFDEGKGAYKIRVKKQSVHYTSTGNAGPKGFSSQLEFVIDRDWENAAQVLRVLKNRGDVIFFAENHNGGFTVLYDPTSGTEVNANFDSGTTPDSDSGITVTVTSNPNRYPMAKWNGTLVLKSSIPASPPGEEETDPQP